MRARNLKPGFFKNEELAEVPYEARLLFAGLWCMADREGRLEDRPKRVKAEIFPYDRVNIEGLLDVITSHGFILRYESNSNRYIQIVNFDKHQKPHPHEAKSNIQPCNDIKRNVMLNPSSLNPSSLNPSSLNPESLLPRGAFESVWGLYPRKLGKDAALRYFKAQVTTPEEFAGIQKALSNFITDLRKKGTSEEYIPHGSTWFNKRWKDWINYGGATLPPQQKAPPKFHKPEIVPPDPTAAEIKEMHDDKVKALGVCRIEGCAFCEKVGAADNA